MKGNIEKQQERLEKKKIILKAEVSYQVDIWLSYCIDGTMKGLRRNIWRS